MHVGGYETTTGTAGTGETLVTRNACGDWYVPFSSQGKRSSTRGVSGGYG